MTTEDIGAGSTVGTLILTGSTNSARTITLTNPITFDQDGSGSGTATLSNTDTSTGTTNALIFNGGTIALADDLMISNTGGSTATAGAIQIGSVIGGTGNLTLSSVSNTVTSNTSYPGALRLSGANTFTGSTTIAAGAVTSNSATAFGSTSNTVTLGSTGGGSATFVITSGGVGSANAFVVAAGTGNGSTFTLGSNSTSSSANNSSQFTGTLTLNGNVSLESEFSTTTTNNSVIFSNTISGVGGLTKVGVGSVALSSANTFSGTTNVSNGRLILSNSLALQNSTVAAGTITSTTGAASGILFSSTVTGNAFTFGGLSGANNVILANNATTPAAITLSVGNNNTDTAYSGILSGTGGNLSKSGIGTFTLSNSNTYTGTTAISGGTLRANGGTGTPDSGTSATGTGAVTISGSGTLGGGGRVAGTVDVQSGGTITAGTSNLTPGTLTTGGETWNPSGKYVAKFVTTGGGTATGGTVTSNPTGAAGGPYTEFGGGSTNTWDTLAMSTLSVITTGGKFVISLVNSSLGTYVFDSSTAYRIASFSTAVNLNNRTAYLNAFQLDTTGLNISQGSDTLTLAFNDAGTGLDVLGDGSMADAPEPMSAMLFGLGTSILLTRRRKIVQVKSNGWGGSSRTAN